MKNIDYDLIIIGSGPAGMNACLYATRAKLKTLVIEKNCPGGRMIKASTIENWISSSKVEGTTLALEMYNNAFLYGGEYKQGNVLEVVDNVNYKEVKLEDASYTCYALIIAIGISERKIGINGEDKYVGKGVSYCPVCDANLYKNKIITVIGNSTHALEEAIFLSKYASNLYIINDKEKLETESDLDNLKNIKVLNKSKVESINGEDYVESITVNGEKILTDAVFPLIGEIVDTRFVSRLNITDNNGYIIVDDKKQTKIDGIYAAGDCTTTPLKQIISACSDGAIAAMEANRYINSIKNK